VNNAQKVIFSVFLPLTALILVLDPTSSSFEKIQYVRFATVLALFFIVMILPKKFPEQKTMAPAFFCMALGDFFLVFIYTIEQIHKDLSWIGTLSFLTGYLFLIKAYRKKTISTGKNLAALVPFLTASILIGRALHPYAQGPAAVLGIAFLAVLCTMAWRAATTLFTHHFSKKSAIMIAASGALMFLCDAGIAFSLFHPYYSTVYIAWLKNIVWTAYLIGWSLAAMVIAEDDLYVSF
jgi:hypothetical protein